jgi:hypothetical protein
MQPGGQVRCSPTTAVPGRHPIRSDRRPPPVQWRDRPPFATAFDENGTSQRRNTEDRLTHRWEEEGFETSVPLAILRCLSRKTVRPANFALYPRPASCGNLF